jgi:hypothetical protein
MVNHHLVQKRKREGKKAPLSMTQQETFVCENLEMCHTHLVYTFIFKLLIYNFIYKLFRKAAFYKLFYRYM